MTKPLLSHGQLVDAIRVALEADGCGNCRFSYVRKASPAEQAAFGRNWMLNDGISLNCPKPCHSLIDGIVLEMTKYDVAWA
jgi:hypothetical protein